MLLKAILNLFFGRQVFWVFSGNMSCFATACSVYCLSACDVMSPPPNWYHVFLQEIQDRIRIIELYAKDRQFADFVRQHQAWVPPLCFFFYSDEINTWAEQNGIRGEKGSEFEIQESGEITSWRRCGVQAMPNQRGNRFIILKSSPARPGADTVRQKPLWDTDIPPSANSLAVIMCRY